MNDEFEANLEVQVDENKYGDAERDEEVDDARMEAREVRCARAGKRC